MNTKQAAKCTKTKTGCTHVVIDGKEFTEFTSYKGKSKGTRVRVPRRNYNHADTGAFKWAHVEIGHILVGPVCVSKHGKRRLMVRHRHVECEGKSTTKGCRSLLHVTSMTYAVRAQKDGKKVHFADEESEAMYTQQLEDLKYGRATNTNTNIK
jgi:hypothetical protein